MQTRRRELGCRAEYLRRQLVQGQGAEHGLWYPGLFVCLYLCMYVCMYLRTIPALGLPSWIDVKHACLSGL